MKNRVALIAIVILLAIVSSIALLACTPETSVDTPTDKDSVTIKIKDYSDESPYELTLGEKFSVENFILIVKRADGSSDEVRLTEDMLDKDELKLLASPGTYSLTVTYSENSSLYYTFLKVVVKPVPQEKTLYDVHFDLGEHGEDYIEPLQDRRVSTLSRPSHTYKQYSGVRLYEYLDVEWYTTEDFSQDSLVEFPLTLTDNVTLYAKFVDGRRVDVEYYVVRVDSEGSEISATGSVVSRSSLVADSALTMSSLTILGADLAADVIPSYIAELPTAPSTPIAGYTLDGWEIYLPEDNSYESVSYSGENSTFNIQEKYLSFSSSRTALVKVYLIFKVNMFTVRFEGQDALFRLTPTDLAPDGYSFDVFGNVVVDETNYHLYNDAVYTMTEVSDVTFDGSSFEFGGISYTYSDGKIYSGGSEINGAIIVSGGDMYYAHVPSIILPYNRTLTDYPYVIARVGQNCAFYTDAQLTNPMPQFVGITTDYTFYAGYSRKSYDVRFYSYGGDVPYKTFSVLYGDRIAIEPSMSSGVGYNYAFDINGTSYATSSEIADLTVYSAITVKETRTPIVYENVFLSGSTEIARLSTPYKETIATPSRETIVSVLPDYDREYNSFYWVPSGGSDVLATGQTQGASPVTYVLKKVDLRKLKYRYLLSGTYSQDNLDKTSPYVVLEDGDSYYFDLESSAVYASLKPRYRITSYSIGTHTETDLSSISFGSAFADAYLADLDYDDDYVYTVDIVLNPEVVSYTITFTDSLVANNNFTLTKYYGDTLTEADTAALTLDDVTLDGTTYHFNGWYLAYGDKETYVAAFSEITASVTYVAKWRSEEEGSYGLKYRYDTALDAYFVSGYEGFVEEVYIASEYQGLKVIGIDRDAFLLTASAPNASLVITRVYLPSSIDDISYIDTDAFSELVYSESLNIRVASDALRTALESDKSTYFASQIEKGVSLTIS